MPETHFRISKKYIGIVIIVFGSIFFVSGLAFTIDTIIFHIGTIQTNGEITDLLQNMDSDDNIAYKAVFSFIDNNNVKHSVQSNYSSNPPVGHISDIVKIRYKANDPQIARIDNFMNFYAFNGIFLLVGFVILTPGIFLLKNYYKNLHKSIS